MQNPEVWSFHEPQSHFRIQKLATPDKISSNYIQNFHYSHLACVVIPDCLRIPEDLANLLSNDCEYYKVVNLNLSDLLNSAFLSNFIKKGKLALLSIGTRIDCDNCCAITPAGNLVLSLTKDTYQTLGLEGKASHFTQRNRDRYIVKIDLTDPKLVPGKPCYKRLKSSLQSLETFTVIVSWEPPEESICPSSVAKFFDAINYKVFLCEPTFSSHVVYSSNTPTLEESEGEEGNIIDFIEWLGMVSLDADLTGSAENYVNTYEPPEPNKEMGPLRVLTWRGFYQPSQIAKLFDFLKKYNQNDDKIWTSMYVQGFSDAPIKEFNVEQNYFTNGDNGNIYIFKKAEGWCCTQRSSNKKYK